MVLKRDYTRLPAIAVTIAPEVVGLGSIWPGAG